MDFLVNKFQLKMPSCKQKLIDFNNEYRNSLLANKVKPSFNVGDYIDVEFKQEGFTRMGIFSGICIAKKNKGIMSSFTVVKDSSGIKVTRTFVYTSPSFVGVKVKKARKKVTRAKLYYVAKKKGSL